MTYMYIYRYFLQHFIPLKISIILWKIFGFMYENYSRQELESSPRASHEITAFIYRSALKKVKMNSVIENTFI